MVPLVQSDDFIALRDLVWMQSDSCQLEHDGIQLDQLVLGLSEIVIRYSH